MPGIVKRFRRIAKKSKKKSLKFLKSPLFTKLALAAVTIPTVLALKRRTGRFARR